MDQPPSGDAPPYIVVEGPIGVGKTSLARRLAEVFGSELVLEQPGENPFLERFYAARRRYALPTQLYFLFQRARQLQALRQSDMFAPSRVADFLLQKDALFARVNLDDDEFRLYRQVYDHLAPDVPVPDLVIYLQAPVEVLRERIEGRGVDYEKAIDPQYLQELVDAYTRFFYRYNDTPLLIINAAEINFVDVEGDLNTLVDRIRATRSGRHYFNPLSTA
ncbi:MAG: deoxynucleoside kinase [Arenicellales bacterium]